MTTTTGLAAATAVFLLAGGAAHAGDPDRMDRPEYAKPGQCFEKVRTAEVFDTVPERQLVTPERIEHHFVPAEFDMRDRTVLVTPARTERYPVPATYRTLVETVVVRPESVRTEFVPPVYESVTRQVLVREARTVWKPGYAQAAYAPSGCGQAGYPQPAYATRGYPRPAYAPSCGQGYAQPIYAPQGYGSDWRGQTQVTPTGEILCLVVEPAVYRTVVEQVVRTPERTIEVPVPAVTQQVARQVVDHPGYEASREIPAQYGVVREKVIVRPEHDESFTIPAVYRTVETRRLVTPGRTEWRQTACAVPAPSAPPPPPPCMERCGPAPFARMAPAVRMAPPGPAPMTPRAMSHARVHRRYAMQETSGRAPMRAPAVAEATDGRQMVERLQAALAGRGYYRGAADGVFTQPTREALVRFQRDKGFAAEGELTRESARELGLSR